MELITENAEETKSLGRKMADKLKKKKVKILALSGDLGSGKTTFTQGVAEELGVRHGIISPTFILLRKYEVVNKDSGVKNLYHLDLYRLNENIEDEIKNLGVEEIMSDSQNLVVIEWAEKIKEIIPKDALWVNFQNLDQNKRKIKLLDENR